MKIILSIALAVLSIGSSNAAIVDHGVFTTDTRTELDWLDLTETVGKSYNQVISDASLTEWRYATVSEVSGFFDSFGGDNSQYDGLSALNNGLFDLVSAKWGDLAHTSYPADFPSEGNGYSIFITSYLEHGDPASVPRGIIEDHIFHDVFLTHDYVSLPPFETQSLDYSNILVGSALIRNTLSVSVPEPTTFALIGLGLFGVRRKFTR